MIYNNKFLHFIKYSGVSLAATLLSFVLFYFLTPILCSFMQSSLADGLSTAICYILATIFCYVLNKLLVFRSKNNTIKEAIKFFIVATPKMLITTFCVPFFISLLHTDLTIIKTLVNFTIQTMLFFIGYIFQKIWVFSIQES